MKLIAEIGWNHMGDINLAKDMIDKASESGSDIVKFQTWSVSRLKNGPWDSDGRREIYIKAELSKEDHQELKIHADEKKVRFASSVFSIEDAKLLKEISNDLVKIPSFECRNKELIKYALDNFSEVIVSTGTANSQELDLLASYLPANKSTLMHCVSSYPCFAENANLPRINYIKNIFESVGYSDHVRGIDVAVASLEYEPKYIEKHFTTNNDLPGRDNKFAILPKEMKSLVDFSNLREKLKKNLGVDYQLCENESRNLYDGRFNAK